MVHAFRPQPAGSGPQWPPLQPRWSRFSSGWVHAGVGQDLEIYNDLLQIAVASETELASVHFQMRRWLSNTHAALSSVTVQLTSPYLVAGVRAHARKSVTGEPGRRLWYNSRARCSPSCRRASAAAWPCSYTLLPAQITSEEVASLACTPAHRKSVRRRHT